MKTNTFHLFSIFAIFYLIYGYSCNPTDTARGVIQNYYEAIGGYDNLKSIKTRHLRIGHREKGLDATIILEIYSRRPDIRRVNWSVEGMNMAGAEGFTGSIPWEVNPNTGETEILTGPKGDAARRGAEFDESFVDADKKGHSVKYAGSTEIFETPVHHLEVTLRDGWIKDYYFDKNTHLVVGLKKTMPLHGEGDPIPSVTKYSDYREINGVLYPHKFEEYNVETDEWMSGNDVLFMEVNQPIADSLLAPPEELQ